ncbi:MAG: hypothetical protein AAF404_10460, partial [Pseudomonadota bacterium]
DGLAVGFVVNSGQTSGLKDHQRIRYTDKLASAILELNPGLQGRLDSQAYVAARVGKPMADLIKSFRLEGDLSARAMQQLYDAQLRRRYLMLATISPIDQVIELQADVKPRSGPANYNVEDYEDVRLHTVRLKAVRVQTYDLVARSKIQDETYSSDDQDTMLATEIEGRRYVGNSLLAAIANGFSNRIRYGGDLDHPVAPGRDLTLDHLWRQIAANLPALLGR